MAAQLFGIVRPALFPLPNLFALLATDVSAPPATPPKAKPVASLSDHLTGILATTPKLLITLLTWHFMFPIEQARTFQWGWVLHVVVRDLLISWLGAGVWDFLLYAPVSPFRARLLSRKFNKRYPSWELTRFCMFWTTVSTLVASAVEIGYLHLLASGRLGQWDTNPLSLATLAWFLTLPYWRIAHFYLVHRLIHPWRTQRVPDIGALLYKHVHSLHHKSYNPTSWSGISMHPVESFLYYTVCFIPAALGAHPLVFLTGKHDATLGAMWGHDGFAYPGSGSFPHYLHHAKFEVNYGENLVPFDWLFGTFAADAATVPTHARALGAKEEGEGGKEKNGASGKQE